MLVLYDELLVVDGNDKGKSHYSMDMVIEDHRLA